MKKRRQQQQKRKQFGKRWGKKKATDPIAHFHGSGYITNCSWCLSVPTGRTRRLQKYDTTGDENYLYKYVGHR